MTQDKLNSAVKIVRAIMAVKINGTPTRDQIINQTLMTWPKLPGNTFDDFVDVVNAVEGK